MTRKNDIRAMGRLYEISTTNLDYINTTYLSRKIHRQVELSVMIPPKSGPKIDANANTELMAPEYIPRSEMGTISGTITITIEYIPDPPTP